MKGCKIFSSIFVLTIALKSMAFDLAPDASRIISDPNYLPLSGDIFGVTAYTFDQKYSGNVKRYTGDTAYSFNRSTQIIEQTLEYGVSDNFTARIAQSFIPSETTSESNSDTNLHRKGLSNPVLSATYRVLDQKDNPVSVDISGAYSPDIIDAKIPGENEEGTVAFGGQRSTLSLGVGYETRSFTIRGVLGSDYSSGSKLSQRGSDTTQHTSSFFDEYFSLETQTRFTDVFSLNANITYTTYDNREVSYENDYFPKYQLRNDDDIGTNLELNYHFIPNRLVGQLEYRYEWLGDTHRKFDNSQFINADPTTTNQVVHGTTLRLLYRI